MQGDEGVDDEAPQCLCFCGIPLLAASLASGTCPLLLSLRLLQTSIPGYLVESLAWDRYFAVCSF